MWYTSWHCKNSGVRSARLTDVEEVKKLILLLPYLYYVVSSNYIAPGSYSPSNFVFSDKRTWS
jgi:hypothetical protein